MAGARWSPEDRVMFTVAAPAALFSVKEKAPRVETIEEETARLLRMAEYDATVARKRAEILARLPQDDNWRVMFARFNTNGYCGHIIHKGDRFAWHRETRETCCLTCLRQILSNVKCAATQIKEGR